MGTLLVFIWAGELSRHAATSVREAGKACRMTGAPLAPPAAAAAAARKSSLGGQAGQDAEGAVGDPKGLSAGERDDPVDAAASSEGSRQATQT
jgi:hypothetical protein